MSIDVAPKLTKRFFDRAKWAAFKADVKMITMNCAMEWISDSGECLFAMIQEAVEAAPVIAPVVQGVILNPDGTAKARPALTVKQKNLAAAAAKKPLPRARISTNIDNYEEVELRKALVVAVKPVSLEC